MMMIKQTMAAFMLLVGTTFSYFAMADVSIATPAVSGYDVVSYFSDSGPVRGDGSFVSEYDGVTYLFATAENQSTFDSDPEKYLPAYGGYCAMGVAMGKKFYVDPLAWKIVDDNLYLNLNKTIQQKWLEDVPSNITKADTNWSTIEETPAAQL